MRRVVITGAAGGIGAATSEAFKTSGWTVAGIDRRSPPTDFLDEFIHADVSDPIAAEEAFRAAGQLRVDALVNNAAVNLVRRLIDTSVEEWDTVMGVNVRAAQQSIRVLFSRLKESEGAVVNVSSVHAVATSADVAAYAASKGALCALTRAAALELAQNGIRVNAVLPGAVDTPMLREGLQRRPATMSEPDAFRALGARTPLGRVASPPEIAQVILFLADGTRSSFVTGQMLVADGGATAKLSTE